MHARPRFIAGVLAACGVVLAYQALAVSVSTPNATYDECALVHSWATSYIETHPSPTLDELARFDGSHRIAIFGEATPEVQSALAREQLSRLDRSPNLSSLQHRLIAEALVLMTPALYARDAVAAEAFARLRPRIVQAFPPTDTHARGWFDLASVVPGVASPVATERGPSCNCNVSSGQCGCVLTSCTVRDTGCGYGFAEGCDGRCP